MKRTKTTAQLNREIAEALIKPPKYRRHHVTREAGADNWDVAMDAILERKGERAGEIVRQIEEDHYFRKFPNAFQSALRNAPPKVREDFYDSYGSSAQKFEDVEIGDMFDRRGSSSDDLIRAILGDELMYTRRYPAVAGQRNRSALELPDVAIRYWAELGVPTSKAAHAMRADVFRDLMQRFDDEHRRLLDIGERTYGKDGPIISGGFREDWPSELKNKIRFLAHGSRILGEAIHLHKTLSKTRSRAFK